MHITLFTQSFKTICTNIIVLVGLISLISTMNFWVVCFAVIIVMINAYAASYRKKSGKKIR